MNANISKVTLTPLSIIVLLENQTVLEHPEIDHHIDAIISGVDIFSRGNSFFYEGNASIFGHANIGHGILSQFRNFTNLGIGANPNTLSVDSFIENLNSNWHNVVANIISNTMGEYTVELKSYDKWFMPEWSSIGRGNFASHAAIIAFMNYLIERDLKRWVKIPSPGQFRGEGTWVAFDGSDVEWEYLHRSGFLPIHEGPTIPKEK